jgi:hypothetical protein
LALIGCASGGNWSKEGASKDQTAQAYSECQGLAHEATRRDSNITTDIMATRGNDWQRTGVLSTKEQVLSAEEHGRGDEIINRCMIGKGFLPGN